MDPELLSSCRDAASGCAEHSIASSTSAFTQRLTIEGDCNPYVVHHKDDDDTASVGADIEELHESIVFPVADEQGHTAQYPHDEDEIGNIKPTEFDQKKQASHSVIGSGIECIKYLYSTTLLVFSVSIVLVSIFSKQTIGTANMGIHPVVALLVFWFLICWLAMMEGGQGALVGLQPIDKALYTDSHPHSFTNTSIAHMGNNMEHFIIGRQFLVVLVIFVINMMASVVADASVWGLPSGLTSVFLGSGVALILVTIMLGQLTAQINAANCRLDFINNNFMLFTTYVSLIIEMSGLLHSVYLVNFLFSKVTGKPIESNEAPRTPMQIALFWARVFMSLAILGYAFAVTLSALFNGQTTVWKGIPGVLSVMIFFLLMCFVGVMEGMQIALFAVINLPEKDLKHHPTAHRNCQLAFKGQNLQAFLVGRQICVTVCMFVVARITALDIDTNKGDETIFGVSEAFQEFFNTGMLGAVITTIVASLAWRVIASSFPIAFLSIPFIHVAIRFCLLFEKSGVCSASWLVARYHKLLFNYQPDEVYLEGADRHTAEPVTRRDKDIDRLVTVGKFTYSLGLLVFSSIMVSAAIFSKQTTGTALMGIPAVVAFFVVLFLIFWLAMMEGGQGALVGLQPIEKNSYAETHTRAFKCTTLAHRGDNMERFIVGRQFLVVLVVFVINMMGSAVADAAVLSLPSWLTAVFLGSNVALILVTIMIGQLTAQVNAANCMLDFINNYFMLFTTYVSLAIEMSGLLHSVYLIQLVFSKMTGKPIESKELARSGRQSAFFWARVLLSIVIFGFAFAVTLSALFNGQTAMWDGVPDVVSVIIFFGLMCFVGMMEGMQIALFAAVNMPTEQLSHYPIAHTNCELAFRDQNLQAFLIGRQICVTICMFVVARITTLDIDSSENTVFSVGSGVQEFFNTGLLGAIITTIAASLSWRIIASSYPLAFLSNPSIFLSIRLCLAIEASGVCSAAWILGRFNKLLVGFQRDDVYLHGSTPHTKAPVTRRDKDIDITITVVKYTYSMGLLVFSVALVMSAIFSEQTKASESINPIFVFFVIWFMIAWLAIMEGGQGSLVGLQSVDKTLYAESHPRSLKNTNIAHKGANMERFIVGRQFLVVLVIFVINMCGSAIADARVMGLSDNMTEVFLASGLAIILMTIMLGQLTAQINAANCMLDFINNYFMLFTTYVALVIEASGLLHSVYLVQIFFSKVTRKPLRSNEIPLSGVQRALFGVRVVFSLVVLAFSFAVTLSALFKGQTAMYDGVPEAVSVALLFVNMCFVGLMEGMQVALFAVVNLPEAELSHAPLAAKTCKLTFSGNNLQAFLIGRQISVTICMFIVARITSCNVDVDAGEETIFGVSKGIQKFFNTGLLGAVITTICASLAWRILASSFPVAFLSSPLTYMIVRLCLMLESSGICSASWLLALIHKQIVGYQLDDVYIGKLKSGDLESNSASDTDSAEKLDSLFGDDEPVEHLFWSLDDQVTIRRMNEHDPQSMELSKELSVGSNDFRSVRFSI